MNRVAIVGTGQTEHRGRHDDLDAPELAGIAVRAALESAGVTAGAVESAVVAIAPEAFEGVNHPDKWIVDAIGMAGKPTMRVHTGGTTGAAGALAGADLIASGQADLVLVVALQRIGQSPRTQSILNTIWDPIYEKDFALNTIVLAALRSARAMSLHGITEEHWAQVSARNHEYGVLNPFAHVRKSFTPADVMNSRMLAWPIKSLDACPRSEGACAILLASEDMAKRLSPKPAWIQGFASATESYFIGDRIGGDDGYDFVDAQALVMASKAAYSMAGITQPADELDVVELYAPFTSSESQAYEALGFCAKGGAAGLIEAGFGAKGTGLVMNPSGGVQCANPIGATGLIRIAEVANQVMGLAGPHQIEGARRGLATAAGGSSQFYSVTIVGDTPP